VTLRERFEYEYAVGSTVVLARVTSARMGQLPPLGPAEEGPGQLEIYTFQPVHYLKGSSSRKTIEVEYAFGGMVVEPELDFLDRAVGNDSIAVCAFLFNVDAKPSFDWRWELSPGDSLSVPRSRWDAFAAEATAWRHDLDLDSLVAHADLIAQPESLHVDGARCWLTLARVLKGPEVKEVQMRGFAWAVDLRLPRVLCMRRTDNDIYEPMPIWNGFEHLDVPANADPAAFESAIASASRSAPGRRRP
jgi:hypothetical protein